MNTPELLTALPRERWPLRQITDAADKARGWWAEESYFHGAGALGLGPAIMSRAIDAGLVRVTAGVASLTHQPQIQQKAPEPRPGETLLTLALRQAT